MATYEEKTMATHTSAVRRLQAVRDKR